jgi:hypothetical protein
MGWEEPTIFDEQPDDDKKSGARKKSSEHSKLSWWAEFEEDRYSDTGSRRDSRGSADSYSYRSAFDDSDEAWYRQSSFRYSSYRDYSPSSLFRSSFLSPTWTYQNQSSDTKNKAIRALRTLKRNANTVANAAAKISYDVQFSSGADSNGVSSELASGKQQTIYVSPDAICNATAAADEDEAVDALTGFVLLRVQLAQSVSSNVIRDVNETSMRGMALKIAKELKADIATANAADIAAAVVNDYSAGVLAKSMLMRLSRRAVVEDWGGFAPYFVRHAKKFITTKDALLKDTDVSAEILAAKIAYNMAAAEDEITLDPAVAEIVNKHLGAQLPVEQILPACKTLMHDLRAYVASLGGELPKDSLEAALAGGLQKIIDEHAEEAERNMKERDAMRNHMQRVANAIDEFEAMSRVEQESPDARRIADEIRKSGETCDADMLSLFYDEKLADNLATAANSLFAASKLSPASEAQAQQKVAELRGNIAVNMAHFAANVEQLIKRGIDFAPATNPANFVGPVSEQAAKQAEALKSLSAQIMQSLNEKMAEIKANATARANALLEKIQSSLDNVEAQAAVIEKLRKDLNKTKKEFKSAAGPAALMDTARASINEQRSKLTNGNAVVENARSCIDGSKKPSEIKSLLTAMSSITRHDLNAGDAINNARWAGGFATQRFAQAGYEHHSAASAADPADAPPANSWHEQAIENFLNSIGADDDINAGDFTANAVKEANKKLFENLIEAFRNNDGVLDIPKSLRNVPADTLDKLTSAAESLGMSTKDLLALLQNVHNDASHGRTSEMANELGALLREELAPKAKSISPIDDALFGETVEKVTKLLDDSDVNQINDEAKNAAEEDYVAYLNHDDAKPVVKVKKAKKAEISSGQVIVRQTIARNRAAVTKIREALQFQDTKRVGEIYGMRSGDLDEGSLHKLRYDSEYIWAQKTISKLPDVAVGILVDQSGSMSSARKIEQAREMCIILSEAVRKVAGVHLHIYGHTANQNGRSDLTLFEHYSSTSSAENADLGALGHIRAYSNNYDGYAIKETAKLLNQDPAKRKYLFVIADGLPHGNGYCGDEAEKHVASVCSFVRTRLKIPTYAFAVGVSLSDRSTFEGQYGKNNVLFLAQVSQCLPQITRFLRNALQKEKTLVDVSTD